MTRMCDDTEIIPYYSASGVLEKIFMLLQAAANPFFLKKKKKQRGLPRSTILCLCHVIQRTLDFMLNFPGSLFFINSWHFPPLVGPTCTSFIQPGIRTCGTPCFPVSILQCFYPSMKLVLGVPVNPP